MRFFESEHCKSRSHCEVCRDLENGRKWRLSLKSVFNDLESDDFVCPNGKEWTVMPRFRELANGYLVAPQRGNPPTAPEGYEPLAGERYVFVPIMADCEYREMRKIKMGCCDTAPKIYCNKTNNYIKRNQCKECEYAKLRP